MVLQVGLYDDDVKLSGRGHKVCVQSVTDNGAQSKPAAEAFRNTHNQ